MNPFMIILEAIAANPQIESSIGNLVASIATHMISVSSQPEAVKKLGTDLLTNSGQIVHAVLASTPAAPHPPSPKAG